MSDNATPPLADRPSPQPLAPIPVRPPAGRRRSSAFSFNPAHWPTAHGSDPDRFLAPSSSTLGVLNRDYAILAPRMTRSVSPIPPMIAPDSPTSRAPLSRAGSESHIPPVHLPPPAKHDLPSEVAAESEALEELIQKSNAQVAELMRRMQRLQATAQSFAAPATFEQLGATLAARPEFLSLDVARAQHLNLPLGVWKTLIVSILDENAHRNANTLLEERAPGDDMLAGVLYWRARHESESLGVIRLVQRRTSIDSMASAPRRGSQASTSSSIATRGSILGSERAPTRQNSVNLLEQLPPPKE